MEQKGLKKNDPYRALENQISNDSHKPGNFVDYDDKNVAGGKADQAAKNLNAAESAASDGLDGQDKEGVEAAKDAENKAGGFYSGGGKNSVKDRPKATGFKGVAMKGGPVFALLFVLVIVGGLFLGGQATGPFSLVAEFQETFNSMRVSAQARSERFFAAQMGKRKVKSPYNIFGTDFKLSKKQQQKLKEQGIEYDEKYKIDGKKTKVLKYVGADGEQKIVTADNFKQVYMEDATFFSKYNAGSMTWRGAFANWFGTNTRNFLKNNKLTRNLYEKYKEKVESEGAQNDVKAQEKINEDMIKEHIKGEGDLQFRVGYESEDEDGGSKVDPENGEENSIGRAVNSEADVRAKLTDISAKYNSGANAACAIMNTIGAISLLVTANEALQIINLTTSLFEAVDKTKAGLGEEAPINVYANALIERKKTTNVVLEGGENGVDSLEPVAVVRDRSAMESAGIAGLYGNSLVDPNDPSVASFNVTSSIKRIAGGIGTSVTAFRGCALAKMAGAAISGGMDAVKIASCVAGIAAALPTAGLSALAGCAPVAIEFGIQVGMGIVVGEVLSKVVEVLVPSVSSMLMRDLVADIGGEDFGNAVTYGANLYQGSTHRSNGGSLATMDKYEDYAIEQQKVIAENARTERENLSPFDTSSKYTFMGSLVNQMMGFSHANSVMSTLTASGSVMSSSLASLNGSASAAAIELVVALPDSIEVYAGACPYLASIEAIGDSFCNPYVITDMATMDDDPDDILVKVQDLGGFSSDSGDNVTIDPDSRLAKYIQFCDNRQSSFGIADQNIVNEVGSTVQSSSGAVNGLIGSIPVIGDALEIIDDSKQLANIGYISGESCVAGNDVEAESSPDWDEAQYYQRFIEDQSLAESMGLIEKSAVTAYLEDYYKENPIDNSYEGILARYSGLDKESVVALLDVIDYENYIANYDPSDRYVFGGEKEQSETVFESENVMDGAGVLVGQIVYADVRNRYFVV